LRRNPGDLKSTLAANRILVGLNDQLPSDINVLEVVEADPRFHARHDATSRTYLYRVSTRRTAFEKRLVWWVKDSLDIAKMSQAVALLPGRHDFAAYSERDEKRDQSTIVVVEKAAITTESNLILLQITASHFLWKMVRRLVGTIVAVGRGSATLEDFSALLNKSRSKSSFSPARLTAPPSGLFLERITYATAKFK
jgi:tRNA pseudouridine38-40 synthase